MSLKSILKSEIPLGAFTPTLGQMILEAMEAHPKAHAVAERQGEEFQYWTWEQFAEDVLRAAAVFRRLGLVPQDRIGFVTANSYGRLVLELASMAGGMVSVPIFSGYSPEMITELLKFTEVSLVITESSKSTAELKDLWGGQVLDLPTLQAESSQPRSTDFLEIKRDFLSLEPQALALIMFTSGTSGMPKGVELTHENILSQQKALRLIWKPKSQMRFLCYLPWHHSFGGLFERFFALSTGGCLAIDDSAGKNITRLLENFRMIQPEVYFSVPKVYQEIITQVLADQKVEDDVFHPDLKFVFTAAAPLPMAISNIFKAKKVPVAEGWGLTETSPCCTLTPLSLDRQVGHVGLPLPGVEVAIDDTDEILVRGVNLMRGYHKNPSATKAAIDADGWFHTGDLGSIGPEGLKILSRKDRMFKLSHGEKIFPSEIEERIKARCKFVKHAYVYGSGDSVVSMLVFPNMELLGAQRRCLDDSQCQYPCSVDSLSGCLSECTKEINASVRAGFERIGRVVIVPHELSIENKELTPSFKLVSQVIEARYKSYMHGPTPPDASLVRIGEK